MNKTVIPDLGQVSLTARASGRVYRAVKRAGKVELTQLEEN